MAAFTSTLTPEIEQQLAALRESRGLTLVSTGEEGVPLGKLPGNIFGYTYSPLNDSTPLFAKRLFQSFEVHRLSGAAHLLGFATPQEAERIRDGREELDFNLYPEPRGESSHLVDLTLDRIIRAKPVSRSDGNYMPLHVGPANS